MISQEKQHGSGVQKTVYITCILFLGLNLWAGGVLANNCYRGACLLGCVCGPQDDMMMKLNTCRAFDLQQPWLARVNMGHDGCDEILVDKTESISVCALPQKHTLQFHTETIPPSPPIYIQHQSLLF